MGSEISRREVLILGAGAVALGAAPGCAILRGGATHEVLSMSQASLTGGALRIPLSELGGVDRGGVLEVRPGEPHPKLLIGPGSSGGGGRYRVVTAACPHRGCTVGLGAGGEGWECPCHGSRFAADGALLEGPADEGLRSPAARVEGEDLVIELAG